MYYTNYNVAIHWLGNNYIMCNELPNFDDSLWENIEYNKIIEDKDEYDNEYDNDYNDEEIPEIFQWFISDCTESDVKYLTEYFPDLLFTYSNKLDLYVLCVTHYGTSWDYIGCYTILKQAERKLGESK